MANTIEIPISNGFYVSDSLPIGHQECVNLIPVIQQVTVLSERQLIGTAGITQIVTAGSTSSEANRGAHVMAGSPYFVQGNILYRLDRAIISGVETFSLVQVGTSPIAITGSGRVSMADNGTQLMILVPGGDGFIYNKDTDDLDKITSGPFDVTNNVYPQYVVFVDGYFAVNTDVKQWYISNLNDGTTWDILDFGSAEADPDPIVAPIVHNNQIFMLGSETTEGFQNIGGSGFPFQRSNRYLDKGCYSPFTLVSTNQRFFMIGGGVNERPAVWAYEGGSYEKISTTAIDNVLNDYSDAVLNAAFALSWANRGQYFVSFTFPDRTFVYNSTTGLWHEQKSGIANSVGDIEQTRWRVSDMVTAYGYTIVGDYVDGRIGIMDIDTYTEYGTNIVRVFSPQPISNKGKSFRISQVELTMESGVGNGVPEPLVSMAISEDLKTFQYERSRKIGAIGKYGQRTIWRKLGRVPRFAIFKFRISDPVKPAIIKLEMDVL